MNHRKPFMVALATMTLFGALDMIRGVVAPSLRVDYALSDAHLGMLLSVSAVGYLVASLISGWVTERVGIKRGVTAGLFIMVVGVGLTAFAPSLAALVVGYALSGLGSGAMEIGTNALIPLVAEQQQARYFNALHACYGLGATLSPFLAAWSLHALHSWQVPYMVEFFGLLALLILVLPMRYPRVQHVVARPLPPPLEEAALSGIVAEGSTQASVRMAEVYRSPVFYALLVAITLNVVAETGVANWMPTLLRHLGSTPAQSALALSGFYALYTLGRLFIGPHVARIGLVRSVVYACLLSAVSMLIGQFGAHSLTFFMILSGASFGIIFPTISALASEKFPGRTASVLGLLFTSAGLGAAFGASMIGWITQIAGLMIGFSLVSAALFLSALAIAFARRQPPERDSLS
ncbi:MFS transporter [Ferroacidibacillus organovorans]|uniref:Major facilitator superfamily (MFS) profile domain-containing protein n=1 Tax=Ferroacidibacillus organovorans TaxID=1765683 RepID=A0A853KDQ4_9BACL|nr:MFS transporter [Ferroacidibacillus organovorans]KYP80418.1 hypothetical protein AYJ22_11195 [Ferroacidibacillus organovorans]OAG93530.1 hypothetical protein AYW79_10165 [Ferroacidibacillus organovorans]